jgi:hypothetical protein
MMRKSKEAEIAFWREEFSKLDEQTNQRRQFSATFVGPPKPRPKSGLALGLEYLMATGDRIREDVCRELRDTASAKARERGRRRWLTEYADRKRALELASTMSDRYRTDQAGKIADTFESEGTHYEVRTTDRWLSKPDWTPPVQRLSA